MIFNVDAFRRAVTKQEFLSVDDAVRVAHEQVKQIEENFPALYSVDGTTWVADPATLGEPARFRARLYGREEVTADAWVEKRPGKSDVVKGTKIPVTLIEEVIEAGATVDDLVREFPNARRDALAAITKAYETKKPKPTGKEK